MLAPQEELRVPCNQIGVSFIKFPPIGLAEDALQEIKVAVHHQRHQVFNRHVCKLAATKWAVEEKHCIDVLSVKMDLAHRSNATSRDLFPEGCEFGCANDQWSNILAALSALVHTVGKVDAEAVVTVLKSEMHCLASVVTMHERCRLSFLTQHVLDFLTITETFSASVSQVVGMHIKAMDLVHDLVVDTWIQAVS